MPASAQHPLSQRQQPRNHGQLPCPQSHSPEQDLARNNRPRHLTPQRLRRCSYAGAAFLAAAGTTPCWSRYFSRAALPMAPSLWLPSTMRPSRNRMMVGRPYTCAAPPLVSTSQHGLRQCGHGCAAREQQHAPPCEDGQTIAKLLLLLHAIDLPTSVPLICAHPAWHTTPNSTGNGSERCNCAGKPRRGTVAMGLAFISCRRVSKTMLSHLQQVIPSDNTRTTQLRTGSGRPCSELQRGLHLVLLYEVGAGIRLHLHNL